MNREKTLDRIRSLLAMAADTSSPNEAAIAARRARSLMDEHQIQAHEVGEIEEMGTSVFGKAYKFMPKWKNTLSVAVARFNDCQCARVGHYTGSGQWRTQIVFKGYLSDVIVAGAMYEYLCDTIDRLAAAYISAEHPDLTRYPAKIGDAYKKGASDEVGRRLREAVAEREATMRTSTGSSLMVIKTAEVDAKFGKATYISVKSGVRVDGDAIRAHVKGREDGKNISLSGQIGGEKRTAVA